MSAPRVSVILATYNYSSVLRFAIASALEQSFTDFEILVIGDGCTDDSAEVAASFGDPRIRWHNLPENTGHQSAPNNAGLAMARGEFIAYLGHDDLWFPHHLERMLAAIEGADAAYSLSIMIDPASRIRLLSGTTASGCFEPDMLVPASTIFHRTDAAREIGGWRDFRTLYATPELALMVDFWAAGKRIAPVREATVLKFPSPWIKDSYKLRPSQAQELYFARIRDPRLLIEELNAAALAYVEGNARSPVSLPKSSSESGMLVDSFREQRGLPPASGHRAELKLYEEPIGLRLLNRRRDIVPADGLDALFSSNDLPANSIFLGRNWYPLESEGATLFRWLESDGEIVIPRPASGPQTLLMEIEFGPGQSWRKFELRLAVNGTVVSAVRIARRKQIQFRLPPLDAAGASLRLIAPKGGVPAPGDPRIMNLRVFSIRWLTRNRWRCFGPLADQEMQRAASEGCPTES